MYQTVYHAYLAGFSEDFDSLEELRTWAQDKIVRFRLKGKGYALKIWQGKSRPGVAVFDTSCPHRVIEIDAT